MHPAADAQSGHTIPDAGAPDAKQACTGNIHASTNVRSTLAAVSLRYLWIAFIWIPFIARLNDSPKIPGLQYRPVSRRLYCIHKPVPWIDLVVRLGGLELVAIESLQRVYERTYPAAGPTSIATSPERQLKSYSRPP